MDSHISYHGLTLSKIFESWLLDLNCTVITLLIAVVIANKIGPQLCKHLLPGLILPIRHRVLLSTYLSTNYIPVYPHTVTYPAQYVYCTVLYYRAVLRVCFTWYCTYQYCNSQLLDQKKMFLTYQVVSKIYHSCNIYSGTNIKPNFPANITFPYEGLFLFPNVFSPSQPH